MVDVLTHITALFTILSLSVSSYLFLSGGSDRFDDKSEKSNHSSWNAVHWNDSNNAASPDGVCFF